MRVPVMAMSSSGSNNQELEGQMFERLSWLKFGGLERGVQALLKSEGFKHAAITGNMHWRGRSHSGGYDLRAWRQLSNANKLTLVQVKHIEKGKVQRRFVDELRGVLLRKRGSIGLIVTNGFFAKPAIEAAEEYPPLPVRLIDGAQLARLMMKHCLGVRVKPLPMNTLPELVIDDLFFDRLEELGQ